MRQSSMVRQSHQFWDCLRFLFGPTECPCLLMSLLLFSLNIYDSVHECPTSHFTANCTISQSLSVASGCRHSVQPNGRSPYWQLGGGGGSGGGGGGVAGPDHNYMWTVCFRWLRPNYLITNFVLNCVLNLCFNLCFNLCLNLCFNCMFQFMF